VWGGVKNLARLDRAHRRAVEKWRELRRSLPATVSSGRSGLTICSVGFRARQCLEMNDALMKTLNPGIPPPDWLVFDNNVDARELIPSDDPRFIVVRPSSRDTDMGYEHALGIAELLSRVRTRFLLVQDPDCFLVQPDWIRGVTSYMDEHQLGFFGTPINPRRHNSYRYFPYMVCMFVDLARVPAADLCFIPDVWRLTTNVTYRLRRTLTAIPKIGALFRWLLTEQWLTNGWRIKAQYGDGRLVKHESVQPVWDVNEAIPAGSLKRLVHALTPASISPVPKLKDYCSPAGFSTMGAPDVAGLGWEEFVWRQQPFAFHVGSVHGKPGQYEAQLDRVLSHWGVGTGEALSAAAAH